MPFPLQWARAILLYQGHNSNVHQMICWYYPDGMPTLGNLYAGLLADEIDGNVGNELRNSIPADAKYIGTYVSINDNGTTYTGSSTALAGIGAVVGDSLPDLVCVVVRKRAAVPGRSGTGRWRVGCVPESYTDDNVLTGAAKIQYGALGSRAAEDRVVLADSWHAAHHSAKNDTLLRIVDHSVDMNPGRISRRQVRSLL